MPSSVKRAVSRVAVAVTVLLMAAVAARSIYLLVVGQRWVLTPGVVRHIPYPLALIPLAAAALVLMGVWRRTQLPLAWAGLPFLALFGAITILSEGLPFLVAAALLLPLLTPVQFLHRGGG